MLAYEIIKLACQFCDEDELGTKIKSAALEDLTDAEKSKIKELLDCLNLVQDELACEYAPLVAQQKVYFQDNKFELSALDRDVVKVLKVKDKFGGTTKFKVLPTQIIAFVKDATIIYAYHPQKLEQGSTLEINLPARVIAYGTAREYFLKQGLSDDADLWEMRFKDSLKVLLSKNHAFIKERGWL